MKSKSLTIAAILSSTLIIVGVSGADDINLDKPRFKAGDCLVWTSPTSESSSVVKIKKLNTLIFRGETARFYEIESGDEVASIQTWQFDVGDARKFNCKNFDQVKSEVESKNKAISDAEESRDKMLKEAQLESNTLQIEYSEKQSKIEKDFLWCKVRANILAIQKKPEYEESMKNCSVRKDAEESSLRMQREEAYQNVKSKYPLIKITIHDEQIFVD